MNCQDLKTSLRGLFKTFRPFLNTKGNDKNGEIKLNVNGTLVNHFATMADSIGGTGAQLF